MTDVKIYATSAIVDSLFGFKFNWSRCFMQNIEEAAKDFETDPKKPQSIERRGKLRLVGKLSYALEELFPDRNWTGTHSYKKVSVFNDLIKPEKPLVDGGMINVDVRPTVPIPKASKKGGNEKKRAASPKKKAAPKNKTKRVASLAQPSEGEASPSGTSLGESLLKTTQDEEAHSPGGQEVNQPQASQTQPIQPQNLEPQPSQTQASQPIDTQTQPAQGIHVRRGVILEDEDSASTFTIPNIPLLNPGEIAAYQIYGPSPSHASIPIPPPTQSTPIYPLKQPFNHLPYHPNRKPTIAILRTGRSPS